MGLSKKYQAESIITDDELEYLKSQLTEEDYVRELIIKVMYEMDYNDLIKLFNVNKEQELVFGRKGVKYTVSIK